MPVYLGSNVVPKNGQTFYLMEDVYLKGSLQIRKTKSEMEGIDPNNLKQGQLVLVYEDGIIYQQVTDLTVADSVPEWKPFTLKRDNLEKEIVDGALSGGGNGGGTGGGTANVRKVLIHTTAELTPQSSEDAELVLDSPSVIVFRLQTSSACRVKIFSTPDRDDLNPYEFVAIDDKLYDDGTTVLSDGSVIRSRQYSILVNLETPVTNKYYLTVTNEGVESGPIVITLTYLPMEKSAS